MSNHAQKNIRFWERILRYMFGVFVCAWAIAGGPWWTYGGVYFLATASFGFCPLYWIFRIRIQR